MHYCTVCKKEYASNFCPNCGQKKVSGKITFGTFLNDLFNNAFSLDKSLFANIKSLIINPHGIVNNYLNGYRGYYSSPGKLLIVASIILALGFSFTKSRFFIVHIDKSSIQEQFLFLFLFVFLLSLLSYLVYYLGWKRTFTEHIIINIYSISLWTVFFTPIAILDYLYSDSTIISKAILYLYFFLIIIWNNRVFEISPTWKRIAYIFLNVLLVGVFVFGLNLYYK